MAKSLKLINGGLTYYPFYDSDKPNYIFSNYWANSDPLIVDGIEYKTPEHYFQCQKFPVGSPEFEQIRNARSADGARREALRLFNQNPSAKANWLKNDNDYKAMLNVVRERLKQDPDFRQELLSTGKDYILEDTYKGPPSGGPADNKWGGGDDGLGDNLLGIALMEARNEAFAEDNRTDLIVDPKKLRKQARDERKQLNSQIQGGQRATSGKPLAEIDHLYSSQTSSTYKLHSTLRGETPKERVLSKLRNYKAIDLEVANDVNIEGGKVIKVKFKDYQTANYFASQAGGAPQDGTTVILGPNRAQHVFKNLGIGQHGRTHPKPTFDALVHDAQREKEQRKQPAASSTDRVLSALKKNNFNASELLVTNDSKVKEQKVIILTLKNTEAATEFARFAGGAPTEGRRVILGPNRAQHVFEKLGIGQHGRTNPRPMFEALVHDNRSTKSIETETPEPTSNGLNSSEEELFRDTFDKIYDSSMNLRLKKELTDIFVAYKNDIEKDRFGDTADEIAHARLLKLNDKYPFSAINQFQTLVSDIKREVVSNNSHGFKP